jgi:D-arginine dehydrogenase
VNDFIVVGGGIAGLSAAARLQRLGQVTVLEAEDSLGYHASGRSAALFEQNYGSASTIALNIASRDFHMDHGFLSPRGVMLIGESTDKVAFDADQSAMHLDPITLSDAQALFPILNPAVVDRVAYHADAWDIDTDRLIQHFARDIRAQGGQIITRAQVTQISHDARTGWDVVTAQGRFQGRQIVNAAGAWADQIAALAGVAALGIQPLRRSMARIAAPQGYDIARWPMVFGPGENFYAKPDAGALIVSPADEDPVPPHDAYSDDMVLAEGLARYEHYVTTPVTRMIASWAGLRSFAPDRGLVLGPDPAQPDFIWCAGQGGYGMQSAPAASQLLADLIGGNASLLDAATIRALRPERLRR